MLKKLSFIIAAAALVVGVGASTAQAYTFTRNLTLGSTGEDVRQLQMFLNSNGFGVAVSGVGSTGLETTYFGNLTRSALVNYQQAKGITPAVGYFGPITRSAINGSDMGSTGTLPAGCTSNVGYSPTTGADCSAVVAGSTLPAGCTSTVGYSSTTGTKCDSGSTLPAGCTTTAGYSPTTGAKCDSSTSTDNASVNDNKDGSITIAASSLVSSGQQVKKGETKNVLSTRLKATAGNVAVNRVDVNFSERPWLTMSQIQIKDGNGNVLATRSLNDASDTTEITVGSSYDVRVDGLNLVVTPGQDVDLVVAVTVRASSDKITGQTVTINVPSNGIRTVNGQGFSDSIGPSASFTFTLPTTGSNADIYTSISSNSPLAGFKTVGSGTTQTENVTLGVFRLKSQNTAATLNSLNFNINNSGAGAIATTTLFSNVQLVIDGKTYGASSLVAGGSTFTNMQVDLPVDQWVEATLKATVAGADTSSGVSASTTLVAASISGIDTNFNTPTVSNATDVTSSDQTFLQSGAAISNASGTLGPANADPATSYSAVYKFTVTNTGNSGNIFISKTPGVALATSSTGSVASSTITIVAVDSPDTDPSDTSTSYAVPSGQSRVFTYTGVISRDGATTGLQELAITGVKFGATSAANAASTISTGLGNLKAVANF